MLCKGVCIRYDFHHFCVRFLTHLLFVLQTRSSSSDQHSYWWAGQSLFYGDNDCLCLSLSLQMSFIASFSLSSCHVCVCVCISSGPAVACSYNQCCKAPGQQTPSLPPERRRTEQVTSLSLSLPQPVLQILSIYISIQLTSLLPVFPFPLYINKCTSAVNNNLWLHLSVFCFTRRRGVIVGFLKVGYKKLFLLVSACSLLSF